MRFDLPVALFAAGVMILAAVRVGLLPALTTADVRLISVINDGGRSGMAGPKTRRLLSTLVVGEVALALALGRRTALVERSKPSCRRSRF